MAGNAAARAENNGITYAAADWGGGGESETKERETVAILFKVLHSGSVSIQ